MSIAAVITIAKMCKQPTCPSTDDWIKIMWYIYTIKYSAIKKKKILPFVTKWMNLKGIMLVLNEISQRKILYKLTYRRNLKKYVKDNVIETELNGGCQGLG